MTPSRDINNGNDSGRAGGVFLRAAVVGFGADRSPRFSRRALPAPPTDTHLEKKD